MALKQEDSALFLTIYEQLRRLVHVVERDHEDRKLDPAALVQDAWLKLAGSLPQATASPARFKQIAARAMRQVLIDVARRQCVDKRSSGIPQQIISSALKQTLPVDKVLALDRALQNPNDLKPRQAAVIELRLFGGLTNAEIAELLNDLEGSELRE